MGFKSNPANAIGDAMWDFLKDGGQKVDAEDISMLKESVCRLVEATKRYDGEIDFDALDTEYIRPVVMGAMALVISGVLDQ